jgi:hypothetical protein
VNRLNILCIIVGDYDDRMQMCESHPNRPCTPQQTEGVGIEGRLRPVSISVGPPSLVRVLEKHGSKLACVIDQGGKGSESTGRISVVLILYEFYRCRREDERSVTSRCQSARIFLQRPGFIQGKLSAKQCLQWHPWQQ